jgi:hypothetical protein
MVKSDRRSLFTRDQGLGIRKNKPDPQRATQV